MLVMAGRWPGVEESLHPMSRVAAAASVIVSFLSPLRGYVSIWDVGSVGSRPGRCTAAAWRLFGKNSP
jgi:hypothetical protein